MGVNVLNNIYICNNITVYTITQKILERSAIFLWTLSGLLSLHFGSVPEVLWQGGGRHGRGSLLFQHSCRMCDERHISLLYN